MPPKLPLMSVIGQSLGSGLGRAASLLRRRPPQPITQPQPYPPRPATTKEEIESKLARLEANKKSWVDVTSKERVLLLESMMKSLLEVAPAMAKDIMLAKGSWGSGLGEEINPLIASAFGMSDYIDMLKAEGEPKPLSWRTRDGGQKCAQVFPQGYSGLLFGGFVGEVWIEPGKECTQGALYRSKKNKMAGGGGGEGSVSVVLGAGNQVTVVILDVLHKLFAEDEVVLLKVNPVNEYVGPHLMTIFGVLADKGWFDVAYGGREVGELLTSHPTVQTIHLTGSADTFNSIVWGSTTAPRTGSPKVTKPFTAELGNLTPYIIVPPPPGGAPWTPAEIKFQAESLVAGLMQNGGCNCASLEVVVTAEGWAQRAEFMTALKSTLNSCPKITPHYPGSDAKVAAFKAKFPFAVELGVPLSSETPSGSTPMPILIAEGLTPDQARYDTESWGPMLQEIVLPSSQGGGEGESKGVDLAQYLAAASDLVNNRCWGSLTCNVTVHPKTISALGESTFDAFIAGLKYGSIAVNVSATLAFCIPSLTWGAYPGNSKENIGSGIGYVHNTLFFDHPEKSVLWGPWSYHPRPVWFMDHRNLEAVTLQTIKFINAGGASLHGPKGGILGNLSVVNIINHTAFEALKG